MSTLSKDGALNPLEHPPLNKIPPGLLDFFGVKSGAWGPRVLGQTLAPVIDLSRWYLDFHALQVRAQLQTTAYAASSNAGALTVTSTTPVDIVSAGVISVPQTEVWLLLEATIVWHFSAHAGSQSRFTWQCAGRAFPTRFMGFAGSTALIQLEGSDALASPQWLLPGEALTPYTHGVAVGAGGTVSLGVGGVPEPQLRVARFRI